MPIWRTATGLDIPVSEMSDGHVLNAKNWCLRAAAAMTCEAFNALSYAATAPDGAAYAAENEANVLLDKVLDLQWWEDAFEREINKRHINPN